MIGINTSASGTAKAKDIQESLSNVVHYTQENLDRLEQQKPNHHHHSHSYSSSSISGGTSNGGMIRSSSSGRLSNSALYTSQSQFPDYDGQEDHYSITGGDSINATNGPGGRNSVGSGQSGSVQDRKVDLLMKKMKVMEDRCKKYEKDISQQQQVIVSLTNQCETLQDTAKQEKKSMSGIKEQLSYMKQRVDLLMNQEEARNRYQQATSTGSTGNNNNLSGSSASGLGDLSLAIENNDWLRDFINQRIASEVSKAIDTYHYQQTVAPAASHGKNTSTAPAIGSTTTPYNRQVIEQLTAVEKEMIKLTSEFERLKSKQSYLDRIYGELKEMNHNKEQKLEENNRKIMNTFRHECDLLIKTTSKTVNDYLTHMETTTNNQEELKELVENSIDKTGKILAEFDERILQEENNMQQFINTVNLLKNKEMGHESRLKEIETMIPSILQECEEIVTLKDTIYDVTQSLENQRSTIQQQESMMNKLHKQSQQDLLKQQEVLEKKIAEVEISVSKKQQEDNDTNKIVNEKMQQVDDSIQILKESQKKLKAKLRDLYDQFQSIHGLKESMDHVIGELNVKVTQEASRTYDTVTNLQRLESKMNQLEGQEKNLKSDVMLSVAKSMEDFHEILVEFKQDQDDAMSATTKKLVADINKEFSHQERSFVNLKTFTEEKLTQCLSSLNGHNKEIQDLREKWQELENDLKRVASHNAESNDEIRESIALLEERVKEVQDQLQSQETELNEKSSSLQSLQQMVEQIQDDLKKSDKGVDTMDLTTPVLVSPLRVSASLNAPSSGNNNTTGSPSTMKVATSSTSPMKSVVKDVPVTAAGTSTRERDDDGLPLSLAHLRYPSAPLSAPIAATSPTRLHRPTGYNFDPQDINGSLRPASTAISGLSTESFIEFNHLIDSVKSDILALDLHLNTSSAGMGNNVSMNMSVSRSNPSSPSFFKSREKVREERETHSSNPIIVDYTPRASRDLKAREREEKEREREREQQLTSRRYSSPSPILSYDRKEERRNTDINNSRNISKNYIMSSDESEDSDFIGYRHRPTANKSIRKRVGDNNGEDDSDSLNDIPVPVSFAPASSNILLYSQPKRGESPSVLGKGDRKSIEIGSRSTSTERERVSGEGKGPGGDRDRTKDKEIEQVREVVKPISRSRSVSPPSRNRPTTTSFLPPSLHELSNGVAKSNSVSRSIGDGALPPRFSQAYQDTKLSPSRSNGGTSLLSPNRYHYRPDPIQIQRSVQIPDQTDNDITKKSTPSPAPAVPSASASKVPTLASSRGPGGAGSGLGEGPIDVSDQLYSTDNDFDNRSSTSEDSYPPPPRSSETPMVIANPPPSLAPSSASAKPSPSAAVSNIGSSHQMAAPAPTKDTHVPSLMDIAAEPSLNDYPNHRPPSKLPAYYHHFNQQEDDAVDFFHQHTQPSQSHSHLNRPSRNSTPINGRTTNASVLPSANVTTPAATTSVRSPSSSSSSGGFIEREKIEEQMRVTSELLEKLRHHHAQLPTASSPSAPGSGNSVLAAAVNGGVSGGSGSGRQSPSGLRSRSPSISSTVLASQATGAGPTGGGPAPAEYLTHFDYLIDKVNSDILVLDLHRPRPRGSYQDNADDFGAHQQQPLASTTSADGSLASIATAQDESMISTRPQNTKADTSNYTGSLDTSINTSILEDLLEKKKNHRLRFQSSLG